MNILNMLGLMTNAKHREMRDLAVVRLESALVSKDETIERVCAERDRLKDKLGEEIRGHTSTALDLAEANKKFNQAAKDLAGLSDDVAAVEKVADARARKIAELNGEIAALKPDAEAFRKKRANDAALKREKRAAAKVTPIKAKRAA